MTTEQGEIVARAVYTIGHSSASADEVVRLLESYGIGVLVDVRSVPYSQHTPQFNREVFEATLADHGIEYRFAGEHLGGRPKDPTCYRDRRLPTGKADYVHLVDYPEVARRPWFKRGIQRLMQIAGERPTAIMCAEENPRNCHRHHLIATSLLAEGVRVVHIRHDRAGRRTEDASSLVREGAAAPDDPQQLAFPT